MVHGEDDTGGSDGSDANGTEYVTETQRAWCDSYWWFLGHEHYQYG